MTAHALYRFYGANGELLYIGITANVGARLKQHAHGKPWWTDVHHIKLEHFDNRADVLAAEMAAILAENPRHNVVYNRNRRPEPAAPLAAKPTPSAVEMMNPEQFARYMIDRHPRVHGPWPKYEPKPCWVCGDDLIQPTAILRLTWQHAKIVHRTCRDAYIAENPDIGPKVDSTKQFLTERRDAILRGEIL